MKKQQSSITAEGIALIRALESQRPEHMRICYDPLARYFVSPFLWAMGGLFNRYGQRRSPGVYEFLVVRCQSTDDYLQACLDKGFEQFVILGAGFDSRAYRFDALVTRRVFEVDHPATQAVKTAKVKKILGGLPAHVTYVPIDFAEQTLEQLCQSGYSPPNKTLFIWEGVSYYLPAAAVDDTLAFVAQHSPPGSSIIFDYVDAAALTGRPVQKELVSMRRYQRFTGEGIIFGIPASEIEPFLAARGFGGMVNMDSAALKERYLTGVNANRPIAPVYAIARGTVQQ